MTGTPQTKGSAQRGWIWIVLGSLLFIAWLQSRRPAPSAQPPSAGVTPVAPSSPAMTDAQAKHYDRLIAAANLTVQLKAAARNPDSFVLEEVQEMSTGAMCFRYA